jgi:hypothetical protein
MIKRFSTLTAAALLWLASSAVASAQIKFRIDTFNSDELTLTIFGGPTSTFVGEPTHFPKVLDFSIGPNGSWFNPPGWFDGEVLSGGTTYFGNTIDGVTGDDVSGHGVWIWGVSNFVAGDYFTTDTQISWHGDGLFNVEAVAGQTIFSYWGTNVQGHMATGVLQGSGLFVEGAVIGGGPAIPEPSTYAAMAGVAALGFAAWRRRRCVAMAS